MILMSDASFDETIVNEPCAKAPLNPRWRLKLGVIAFIVFLVGCWGLWDATSVYPNRGKKFAEWAKWQYLEQAKNADSEDFGIFLREASVTDPGAEFARLSAPERMTQNRQDSANPNSSRTKRAAMQMARHQWLEALRVVGMLDAEHTTIESPQRQLDELRQKWSSTSNNPKPLSSFDLLTQWLIMGVCYTVTIVMVIHMMRVASVRYAWEPETMTLTLPDGAKVTPDDLEEIDKRKWDKFIVFLKIRDTHDQLGGQEVRVDTYQHTRVEDWILAMEAKAFPSQQEEDAPKPEPEDSVESDQPGADEEQQA
jgi:hypothetical protein